MLRLSSELLTFHFVAKAGYQFGHQIQDQILSPCTVNEFDTFVNVSYLLRFRTSLNGLGRSENALSPSYAGVRGNGVWPGIIITESLSSDAAPTAPAVCSTPRQMSIISRSGIGVSKS